MWCQNVCRLNVSLLSCCLSPACPGAGWERSYSGFTCVLPMHHDYLASIAWLVIWPSWCCKGLPPSLLHSASSRAQQKHRAPNNNILSLQELLDIIRHTCMDEDAHHTSASSLLRILIFPFSLAGGKTMSKNLI